MEPSEIIARAANLTATATVILAIFTAGLFFYAMFSDWILGKFRRPKLDMAIDLKPPHSHLTEIRNKETGNKLADAYYIRIQVFNDGNIPAEQVEVFATSLTEKTASDTFESVLSFLPMNLKWSHIHVPFFPRINPGGKRVSKHCDLIHIIDPSERSKFPNENLPDYPGKTVISFDQIVQPFSGGHLVGPGTYRLELTVNASNASPISREFEINLTGDWYDDEDMMFKKGVGITQLT